MWLTKPLVKAIESILSTMDYMNRWIKQLKVELRRKRVLTMLLWASQFETKPTCSMPVKVRMYGYSLAGISLA